MALTLLRNDDAMCFWLFGALIVGRQAFPEVKIRNYLILLLPFYIYSWAGSTE
jgi:hypothetical protein